MLPMLETVLAFVAAMLAASLFVSAVVQVVQGLGRYRSRTVAGMLYALIHGYRVYYNDPDILEAEAETDPMKRRTLLDQANRCEAVFVRDILADPALHSRGEAIQFQDDPDQLSAMVEYIDEQDLIDLGRNYAEYYSRNHPALAAGVAPPFPLPVEWIGGRPGIVKAYADTDTFTAYVKRWFKTLEGTAAESFKQRIRRLTLVVSCSVVIVLNLDGIDLIRALYRNGGSRQALIAQSDTLRATAERLGVAAPQGEGQNAPKGADRTTKELALELQKTATILDEADAGIGWQNSWITRRWAAFRGVGGGTGVLPPPPERLFLDTSLWLIGLLFSMVMLSLGAPFWVTTMAQVIRLKNEVRLRKESPT